MRSPVVFNCNPKRAFVAVIADALSIRAARPERLSVERHSSRSSLERSDEEEFAGARLITSFRRADRYLKAFASGRNLHACAAINATSVIRTRPIIFIDSRRSFSLGIWMNIEGHRVEGLFADVVH